MFCRIRFKLSLFVFLLLIFTTFVFSLGMVKILNHAILKEIIKRAESLSKSSASVAAYNLISNDALGMGHLVFNGKESNRDVEYLPPSLGRPPSLDKEVLNKKIRSCKRILFENGLEQYRAGNLSRAVSIWKSVFAFDPEDQEIKKNSGYGDPSV